MSCNVFFTPSPLFCQSDLFLRLPPSFRASGRRRITHCFAAVAVPLLISLPSDSPERRKGGRERAEACGLPRPARARDFPRYFPSPSLASPRPGAAVRASAAALSHSDDRPSAGSFPLASGTAGFLAPAAHRSRNATRRTATVLLRNPSTDNIATKQATEVRGDRRGAGGRGRAGGRTDGSLAKVSRGANERALFYSKIRGRRERGTGGRGKGDRASASARPTPRRMPPVSSPVKNITT